MLSSYSVTVVKKKSLKAQLYYPKRHAMIFFTVGIVQIPLLGEIMGISTKQMLFCILASQN
jgi:hypothetical protein